MQAQTLASGLRAQLPARVARSSCRAAVSCAAAPQRRQQQQAAPEPSAATALALGSFLLVSAPAWAEEAESAASAAAVEASGTFAPLGILPAGWALILSPVLFYGVFNIYRSQVNPKANFGDAIFVLAALVIATNIFCITVLKIRLF